MPSSAVAMQKASRRAKLNQKVTNPYPIPGYPTQSQSSSMDVSITQLNIPIYYKYNTNELLSKYPSITASYSTLLGAVLKS